MVKCAELLLFKVEQALRTFTRANRYGYGMELRTMSFKLASVAHRAWREPERRDALLAKLIRKGDDFKTYLRLGWRLKVMAFGQFEDLARTANSLGRQAQGWRNKLHLKSQNPAAQITASPERAQILSSRAASAEVKP